MLLDLSVIVKKLHRNRCLDLKNSPAHSPKNSPITQYFYTWVFIVLLIKWLRESSTKRKSEKKYIFT